MTVNRTPQNAWNEKPNTGVTGQPGPYLAEVMDNADPLNSGRILVYIPDLGGDPADKGNWHLCRYMTPYYGIAPLSNSIAGAQQAAAQGQAQADAAAAAASNQLIDDPELAAQAQAQAQAGQQPDAGAQQGQAPESYGLWMQPPDVGVKVLVMFINADRSRGVWIGCLPEMGSHAAIPGQDAADFDITLPENQSNPDITSIPRQPHSTAPTFETQGIQGDQLRGPITSSSFRESPSQVFGFNSQRGHSFVMDDGAAQGGQNKLIRIRTTAGNQIMMNDDAGLIYIINASGTGWIEVSPSGHIDVYGAAGINMSTDADINLHADKNVNIHAGENVKIVAMKNARLQGTESLDLFGQVTKMEGVDALHMHSCKELRITSFGEFHQKGVKFVRVQGKCLQWNSMKAKDAEQVIPEQPQEVTGRQTTVARTPTKEPWAGHDGGGSGGGGGGAGGSLPEGAQLPNGFPAEIAQAFQQAGIANPVQALQQVLGGNQQILQTLQSKGFNPQELFSGASGLSQITQTLGIKTADLKRRTAVNDIANTIKNRSREGL